MTFARAGSSFPVRRFLPWVFAIATPAQTPESTDVGGGEGRCLDGSRSDPNGEEVSRLRETRADPAVTAS